MAQHRPPPTPGTAGTGQLPRLPALGDSLRVVRENLNLSRSKAYARHGVSASYLFEIEVNGYVPGLETLDKIIDGYRLGPALARHLRELRAAPEDLAPLSKLHECVTSNAAHLAHLADLEGRGIIAAFVDPLWNILACTDALRANLPGIDETWSVPAWTFSATARQIIIDWEYEATHSVATLKSTLGRYRDSEQARTLIHRLRPNRDFQRLWNTSIDVTHTRDVNDLLHIRDPHTGVPGSCLITVADADQSHNIQLLTAINKPYAGPEPSGA
ncbi:hypothetical protein [Nocardia sp. NPDC057227]|uniref:MmyB family transcriptional regulator n=1 Tax=Nocardia sp. NPDC057227 TaxID=3346056 RepID=UPI00362CEDC6